MGILKRLLGDPEVDRPSTDRLLRVGRAPARRVFVLPSTSRLDRIVLEQGLARKGIPLGTPERSDDLILAFRKQESEDLPLLEEILGAGLPSIFIPCLVVWGHSVERRGGVESLLGLHDRPTRLRRALDLLLHGQSVGLQVGPPLDLRDLRLPSDRRRARWLRGRLARALRAERRTLSGPILPTRGELSRGTVESAGGSRDLGALAQRTGTSPSAVAKAMKKNLRSMAAGMTWPGILFLRHVLGIVWTRIYDGVDISPEDLERIRDAMRRGSVVLLPSHRSHLDYLLLSWLLCVHRIALPHIIAGNNLDVPILGSILRRGGAVFIPRSLRSEPVFREVFDRYLRFLIHRDFAIEVFIEGGRSRSGRMLPPRLGVLGGLLDAAAHHRKGREVTLLPLAITYERVTEATTYAREQQGAAKEPESLSLLFRARKILDERHGRVLLRVGEPLLATRVVDGGDGTRPWHAMDAEARALRLASLGREIIWRISRSQVVLAPHLVALALLASPSTEIEHDELKGRVLRFREILRRCRARVGPEVERVDAGLAQTLLTFEERGWITKRSIKLWRVASQHLIDIDLQSGPAVGYFAEVGLAAMTASGSGRNRFRAEDILQDFARLRALLRAEIVLPPGLADGPLLRDGLRILAATGALRRSSEGFEAGSLLRLDEIVRLLRPLASGHLAFFLELPGYLERSPDISGKELLRAILHERQSLERRWGLPALSILRSTLENAKATAVHLGILAEGPEGLVLDEVKCRDAVTLLGEVLDIEPSGEPQTHPA